MAFGVFTFFSHRNSQRLSLPCIALTLQLIIFGILLGLMETSPGEPFESKEVLETLIKCLWSFADATHQVLSWSFLVLHVSANCLSYRLLANPCFSSPTLLFYLSLGPSRPQDLSLHILSTSILLPDSFKIHSFAPSLSQILIAPASLCLVRDFDAKQP